MSLLDSTSSVAYRSLDFLGFPDYRVGDDGSVWSCRKMAGSTKLSLSDAETIRGLYRTGKFSQNQLAQEFNCSQGSISLIVRNESWLPVVWREKVFSKNTKSGHLGVLLYNGVKLKKFWVHRLVLIAFVGDCPPGKECCHNDGDATNNRVENLRWDTRSANMKDRFTHHNQKNQVL